MRFKKIALAIAVIFMLLIIGCDSKSSVIINPDSDSITMGSRELYYGYDGSSKVIPAEVSIWTTETWIRRGGAVTAGAYYVLPVPKVEGTPTAYIHHAENLPSGSLLLDTSSATPISVWQDTTHSYPGTNFWKLKVDSMISLPAVLRIEWQALDAEGNPFPFKLYYRVTTR